MDPLFIDQYTMLIWSGYCISVRFGVCIILLDILLCIFHYIQLGILLVQIAKMEKLAADRKEKVFDDKFCQKLAEEFK